jgi:hypothetical protein
VLEEQQDEWQAAPRRYFSIESMAQLYATREGDLPPPVLIAGEEVFVT